MLFQVLCGFEPIFYTTHPNEESFMFNSCSNDIDSLAIKNSDNVGKYFALLFINYIYSDRCFELWICIGICKRMWSNDNNWDGIWCNTRLCPIFGKKFRDIGCQTVEYDK